MNKLLVLLACCLFPCVLIAQTPVDTANIKDIDTTGQKDLIDVARSLFKFKHRKYQKEQKEIYFSILPLSTNVPGGNELLLSCPIVRIAEANGDA